MFGGTNDPCALIYVDSIGKLGVEENKVLSKIIFDFIKEKLGIEGTRYKNNLSDDILHGVSPSTHVHAY